MELFKKRGSSQPHPHVEEEAERSAEDSALYAQAIDIQYRRCWQGFKKVYDTLNAKRRVTAPLLSHIEELLGVTDPNNRAELRRLVESLRAGDKV